MESKLVHLPVLKKWFELTEQRIKPEDYREITHYWSCRLIELDEETERDSWNELIEDLANPQRRHEDVYQCLSFFGARFKPFNFNIVTLGYPKAGDQSKRLIFEHAGIEIRTGNPDWGAVPGKLYFVIKHGKRINTL